MDNFDEFAVGDRFVLRFLGGSEELPEMKICSLCKNSFPKTEEYFCNKGYTKTKIRFNCRCKSCERKRLREYAASHKGRQNQKNYRSINREKIKQNKIEYYKNGRNLITKDNNLRTAYGINLQQYEIMVLNQNGLCYICEKEEVNGNSLSVDHNHKTGKVRKLLCQRCNLGLGYFREDKLILKKAASYVEKHEQGELT